MKQVRRIASFILGMLFAFPSVGQVTDEKRFPQNFDVQQYTKSPVSCELIWTEEAPFHISSAYKMGDRSYENFRSKDNHRKKEAYIPKRSIVKIKEGSEEYAEHSNYYVPVEVIGVNETDLHEEKLSKSPHLRHASALRSGLRRTNVGDKGFIYKDSLEKADDFTYVVKEDSPILEDNGLTDMGVVAIKPVVSDGKYAVNMCCVDGGARNFIVQTEKQKNCEMDYRFELVYGDGREGDILELDVGSCKVVDSLTPLDDRNENNIESLLNFLSLAKNDEGAGFNMDKLETLDSRGLVKIPLNYDSFDGNGMEGPFGSYKYNTGRGADDVYAHPATACGFMEVLKAHQRRCQGPGCQIQFGNLYHPPSWGAHETHGDGNCIDIRPLRTDNSLGSMTYHRSNYDQDKTREFIELLKEAGAERIIFNDPGIRRNDRSVRYYRGHHNHIHFCMFPENEKTRAACKNGLP